METKMLVKHYTDLLQKKKASLAGDLTSTQINQALEDYLDELLAADRENLYKGLTSKLSQLDKAKLEEVNKINTSLTTLATEQLRQQLQQA